MTRLLLSLIGAAALALPAGSVPARAAESLPMAEQITPFSVWLDFNLLARPHRETPALPIWFEAFQQENVAGTATEPPKTIFRMRLRRMDSLHRDLLLRIYFDDVPGLQPTISAWSEAGREQYRSPVLGNGIGLPTSECVIVPVDGADYIDVEVVGDGSSVRGAFAASLKEAITLAANDFAQAPSITDPFGASTSSGTAQEDSKLFGRIQAVVDTEVVRLARPDEATSEWLFQLEQKPLATMVTFEVLNADINALPLVAANDGELLPVSIDWPDFADPAYRGESRPLEPSMRFQYTGWLKARVMIPGHLMESGLNKVLIGLSDDSGPIAVRNVELQLKQNWKHFDYILSPVK